MVSPTAAVVVIGNEVLSGKVTDENTPFLTRELRKLGVRLMRVAVIADELETIAKEVRECSQAFDWVFTSGGLGPTHDDLTMAAIAHAFATELVQSQVLVDAMRAMKGDKPPEALDRLTWIPKTAELYWGDGERIWPTVHVGNVYIFPGVPTFLRHRFMAMRGMLKAQPFVTHTAYLGPRESELVDVINRVVAYEGK